MGTVLYIQMQDMETFSINIGRVLLVYVFVCCRARDNKGERTFSTQTELFPVCMNHSVHMKIKFVHKEIQRAFPLLRKLFDLRSSPGCIFYSIDRIG